MGRALSLISSHPLILNPLREIQYKCGHSPNIEIHGWIYVVPKPLQFCASTFGVVCGKRYEKLCRSSTCSDLAPVEEEKLVVETPKDPESHKDKSEIPPPPHENQAEPDESKALAIVEKTSEPAIEEKSKEDSVDRDAAENKAHKKLSAIGLWENTKKATVEAELKKIEEQLGKKKAEYVEQMKNKREKDQNARSIASKPGVVFVFLDPILKLHTTHSWDFLKYQTALKIDSNLNSNNYDVADGVSNGFSSKYRDIIDNIAIFPKLSRYFWNCATRRRTPELLQLRPTVKQDLRLRSRYQNEIEDEMKHIKSEAGAMVCVCVCGSRNLGAERKERDGADEGGAEGDVGEGSRDLGSLCVCVGERSRDLGSLCVCVGDLCVCGRMEKGGEESSEKKKDRERMK
ncbi:hypothetical protein ACFX1Q_001005 [Malus domestica]